MLCAVVCAIEISVDFGILIVDGGGVAEVGELALFEVGAVVAVEFESKVAANDDDDADC